MRKLLAAGALTLLFPCAGLRAEENESPKPPPIKDEQDNAMRGNPADVAKFVDSVLTPSVPPPPLPKPSAKDSGAKGDKP